MADRRYDLIQCYQTIFIKLDRNCTFQTDHSEELEELCQAANHINESGGESGGEFWLKQESAEEISTDLVVI